MNLHTKKALPSFTADSYGSITPGNREIIYMKLVPGAKNVGTTDLKYTEGHAWVPCK